jgi:predicted ATP-dependent serine protease
VSHLKVLYVSGEESGAQIACAPSAWPSMRAI